MSDTKKREPLLSDGDVELFRDEWANGGKNACYAIRDFYEDMITTGKLRVVEEVSNTNSGPRYFSCSGCGASMASPYYSWPPYHSECGGIIKHCPGCGQPIKP